MAEKDKSLTMYSDFDQTLTREQILRAREIDPDPAEKAA